MNQEHENMSAVSAFPKKLYSIVCDTNNNGMINWNSAGDQFIVYNPSEFCDKVLSKNDFSSTNYASFVRQLNMYDFHKIKTKVKDISNTFFHKYFLRDRPSLLRYIKRKPAGMQLANCNQEEDTLKQEIYDKTNKTSCQAFDKSALRVEKNSSTKYEMIEDIKQKNAALLSSLSSSKKKINKSLLHSIYSSYLRIIKLSKKRQDDVDIKLNSLMKKNNQLINENKSILNEINNKSEYSKSLENLFYSILDLLITKNSDSSLGGLSNSNGFNLFGLFSKENEFLDKLSKENMRKDHACYHEPLNFNGLKQIGEETVKFNQSVTGSPSPFYAADSRILPDTDSQLNDIFENDIKLSVNDSICVTPNIEATDYDFQNTKEIKDNEEIFIN